MADYTITLTEEGENRLLSRFVAPYNLANKAALGIAEWAQLHLEELAVDADLQQAAQQAREDAERVMAASVDAERKRLMDLVQGKAQAQPAPDPSGESFRGRTV
ncbi:MAG: hypothetical protein E6J42_06575 [Chloroflexi bacterium]|nr:MAG: hypothetical protein E6J42_06575 [Chloroflexota bacterium]